MNYKTVYEAKESLSWIVNPFGLFIRIKLQHKGEALMRPKLAAIHQELYPRRKKINHANIPDEIVQSVVKDTISVVMQWGERKARQYKRFESWLAHAAYKADIESQPKLAKLRTSSASAYWSQGFGACKYAKGALYADRDLIQSCGFQAEIREVNEHYVECQGGGQCSADYELWANIENWQLDILKRTKGKSMSEWAKNCWRNGVNPAVYNPFLDITKPDFDWS